VGDLGEKLLVEGYFCSAMGQQRSSGSIGRNGFLIPVSQVRILPGAHLSDLRRTQKCRCTPVASCHGHVTGFLGIGSGRSLIRLNIGLGEEAAPPRWTGSFSRSPPAVDDGPGIDRW